MMAEADRDSVRTLITETITMLLQNSVQYNSELSVQGLLGVTVDKSDVFIIHIDQRFVDTPQPVVDTDLPSYSIPDFHPEMLTSHAGFRAKLPQLKRSGRATITGQRQRRSDLIRSAVDNCGTLGSNNLDMDGHAMSGKKFSSAGGRNCGENRARSNLCESLLINQTTIDEINHRVSRNESGNTSGHDDINADNCCFHSDSSAIDSVIGSCTNETSYSESLCNQNEQVVLQHQQLLSRSQSSLAQQSQPDESAEKQQHQSSLSNRLIDIPPNLQAIMQNAINQARSSVNQCVQSSEGLESCGVGDLVKAEPSEVSGCSGWNNTQKEGTGGYDKLSDAVTSPYGATGTIGSVISKETMISSGRRSITTKAEAIQWLTPEEIAAQSAGRQMLAAGSLSSGSIYQPTAAAMRQRSRNRALSSGVVHRRPALRGDPSDWRMVPVVTFACPICNRSFRHKPSLYRHQIDAHGRVKKKRGWQRTASEDEQGFAHHIM